MILFKSIQHKLEEIYGAPTGLNVEEFVRTTGSFPQLGELLVEHQEATGDLNLALLFDRDILAAWEASSEHRSSQQLPAERIYSVPFEEISHFVYLSFNHQRGRNITGLEMELQSEIDRILLAFHGPISLENAVKEQLLTELYSKSYTNERYETSRRAAAQFVNSLSGGNPAAWSPEEFKKLRDFFHNDLSGKLHLSRTCQRNKLS